MFKPLSSRISRVWRSGTLFIVTVALVSVVLWLALRTINWQLNVVAKTEIVRLLLAHPQSWQLHDAIVCVQINREVTPNVHSHQDPACAGRQWQRVSLDSDQEPWALHLEASPESPVEVQLERYPSGHVRMALRQADSPKSLGHLGTEGQPHESVQIGDRVNIIWPPQSMNEANARDDGAILILPFSGAITLGRDVAWGSQRMLLSGEVNVYSSSEEHMTGRAVAEHTLLTLGDRVDIGMVGDSTGMPKGFLRIDRAAGPSSDTRLMDVVVYAAAEQATIHRYGGGHYQFEAGWWLRLKHQSGVVIAMLVATGVLSILSSLVTIAPALGYIVRWGFGPLRRSPSARE